MSRQNSHVRINQSDCRRGNSQPVPERQVANPKFEQPSNSHGPRRNIAIGVNPNQDSNNSQYNPLENPKNSNTNSIAEVVGDFVEAVITSLFGS